MLPTLPGRRLTFALAGALGLLLAACAGAAVPTPPPTEDAPGEQPTAATQADAGALSDAEQETIIGAAPQDDATDANVLPDRLLYAARGWLTDWSRHTVPYDEIFSGGVPRDGIRSIDDPQFVGYDETSEWLADTEPVMALAAEQF